MREIKQAIFGDRLQVDKGCTLLALYLPNARKASTARMTAAMTRKNPTIPMRVFPTKASPFTAPFSTLSRRE